MLFLAILLQTAPGGVQEGRNPPVLPRILDLAPRCRGADCDAANRRFRLDTERVPAADSKTGVLRGIWQPCRIAGPTR